MIISQHLALHMDTLFVANHDLPSSLGTHHLQSPLRPRPGDIWNGRLDGDKEEAGLNETSELGEDVGVKKGGCRSFQNFSQGCCKHACERMSTFQIVPVYICNHLHEL